jgi:RecA/RadA recombinase
LVKQKDDDDRFKLTKASQKVEAYLNRKCYPVQPFSFALALGKIDPETGLPGLPQGCIIEVAGANGKGKSCMLEHSIKAIQDENPEYTCLILAYEPVNFVRMEDVGIDLNRLYILDYSKVDEGIELDTAEQGLNITMFQAQNDPNLKLVGIDSIGGMPVRKEIMDEKGEFLSVDKTPQMAIRATILTRFINQWNTLDPNTRPILFLINHMKDQIEAGGFGMDMMKVNRIGENLNYVTPGGQALKYACDVRVKIDGRKIEVKEGGRPVKHPIFDNNIQTGLEIHLEIYKNKFCGNQGSRRAVGKFDFETKSFDIVDETLSYAAYLDICGISKGATGMYEGIIPDKKLRIAQAKEYFKENPDKLRDIQKEIAKHSNELFGLKKKEKPDTDKSL